jgi:hypothetical protein
MITAVNMVRMKPALSIRGDHYALVHAGSSCLAQMPKPSYWEFTNQGSDGLPNYIEINAGKEKDEKVGSQVFIDLTRGVEVGFRPQGDWRYQTVNDFPSLNAEQESNKLLSLGSEALKVAHQPGSLNPADGHRSRFEFQEREIIKELGEMDKKGTVSGVMNELRKHPDVVQVAEKEGEHFLTFKDSSGVQFMVSATGFSNPYYEKENRFWVNDKCFRPR